MERVGIRLKSNDPLLHNIFLTANDWVAGSPVASPALPAGLGRSISISPSVKPGQKRATPPVPVPESAKRR